MAYRILNLFILKSGNKIDNCDGFETWGEFPLITKLNVNLALIYLFLFLTLLKNK